MHVLQAEIRSSAPKEFERGDQEFLVNKKMMKFPLAVYSRIELNDKIIVGFGNDKMQELFPTIESWRQVFAYDFAGNVLWQIENPWYINSETGEKISYDNNDNKRFPGGDCISSVMYNTELDMIVVWGRVCYQFDTETGKLLNIVARER